MLQNFQDELEIDELEVFLRPKYLRFGDVVERLRWARALTQAGLAMALGKSLTFVQGIERKGKWDDPPVIRRGNFITLASRLGVAPVELRRQWTEEEFQVLEGRVRVLAEEAATEEAGRRIANSVASKFEEWEKYAKEHGFDPNGSVDLNVDTSSEVDIPEIPTFDLPLAAGPWTVLPDAPQVRKLSVLRDGRFRVYIRGDSMEGEGGYSDGSLIEFRILWYDRRGDALEVGKDYYVQRTDEATFKKLADFDDEYLLLEAINRQKYPKKMKVLRSDVVRIARAVGVIRIIN